MTAAGIPLADAVALRRRARPARLLRALLAAAAIGCAVAALLLARDPGTRTFVPLGHRANAVLALDLSASISPDTFSRIAATLRTLSASGGRFALVVFSDLAYEALPPGTPAADLAPLVRFFTIARQGDSQVGSSFPPILGPTTSPAGRRSPPAWHSRCRSPSRSANARRSSS